MHNSFNMRTFEIYLVITICTLGTLLSSCSGFDEKLLFKEIVKLHNDKRRKHNAQDLFLDEQLSNFAMDNEILNKLEENGKWAYHENVCFLLYKTSNIVDLTAENVFNPWYDEGLDYDYENEPTTVNAEHFTQIVWKATDTIGFALVERNNEYWLVVAYFRAGNQMESYVHNVERPK